MPLNSSIGFTPAALRKLRPEHCRYGLMLNEAGFVMDDGVVGRLAPDRFHVTTTTGGAAARPRPHGGLSADRVHRPQKVWLTSTTEQWAVIAIQGPKAREVIAPLVAASTCPRGDAAYERPRRHRSAVSRPRLFRVSFTGELGFEINVPSRPWRVVWEAGYRAGERHGITPYGTETMHVLRAEKGYIIVGQETDGTVIPADLGLDWAVGKPKPDFVGKRSLAARHAARGRKQLVGLVSSEVLEEGAQMVARSRGRADAWSRHVGILERDAAPSDRARLLSGGLLTHGRHTFVPMTGRTIAVG